MAETENETVPQKTEKTKKRKRFSLLILLAVILSLGSLVWTTYSLLDFFQDGGINPATFNWKTVSITGLSAAATADIAWSLTMFADYQGVRIVKRFKWREKQATVNILPIVSWVEVLFVATLLLIHGLNVGGGEAAFAAVLPVLTRFSWMVALADLKDPSDLTDEEKAEIAELERESRRMKARMEATAAKHEAELEEKRRKNAAKLEDRKVENELVLLDNETDFKLKELSMRQENELKALEATLRAELQMKVLETRAQVEEMREEHGWSMGIRRQTQRTIVGHLVPQYGLTQGTTLGIETGSQDDVTSPSIDLAAQGLTPPQQRQAALALAWYQVDAQYGGALTKKDFVEQNKSQIPGLSAPRLSEATGSFPREWFAERGVVFQG
jgi:hypothetical protein